MRRIIRCKGHSALNVSTDEQVPWADVWISWVTERRGKREYYAPALMSAYDLRGERELQRDLVKEYPKDRTFKAELRIYEHILEAFKDGERFFVNVHRNNKTQPEIYTSVDGIDRAEAEKMLTFFLKKKGIDEPVFKWVGTDIVVGQISFGHVAEARGNG